MGDIGDILRDVRGDIEDITEKYYRGCGANGKKNGNYYSELGCRV